MGTVFGSRSLTGVVRRFVSMRSQPIIGIGRYRRTVLWSGYVWSASGCVGSTQGPAGLTRRPSSARIDSMSTERNLDRRARIYAALGDQARLAVFDRLLVSDASPGELAQLLGLPTNLLAHHLGVLEDAKLIVKTRSEGDGRRSYVRLVPDAFAGLLQPRLVRAPRVVFVCTHNSARSQLAAALLAERAAMETASGGTEPAAKVHPRAVRVGRQHGLTLGRVRPVHVDEVVRPGDLVISVCDQAHERLGTRTALHWSVPDPARVDTDAAFERAFDDISARVDRLVPVLEGASRD
jgi:protein-tyrosine-phosphatase